MHQNIARNATKITISTGITLVISMITTMLLSRYLSLKEYGTYSQVLLIVELVTTLFVVGLPSSINYFIAKDENNLNRKIFVSTYYSISTILSLIAGVCILIASPFIVEYFDNYYLKQIIVIIAILPWTKIISSSISNLLIVFEKTNFLFTYQITRSFILIGIVIVTIINKFDFNKYIFMYLLVEMFFCCSVYFIVKNLIGELKFSFDIKLIKQILKFSIPIGLSTVVGTISIQLDKIIISKVFNTEQLAIYSNVSREIPITFIASSITAVLIPIIVKKISENKKDEAIRLWGEASVLAYTFICFFVTLLVVFAPQVISILYSNKYLEGVSVFRIYNIVLLFRFTYFGIMLNSMGKSKIILYISVLSLVLNVILNYPFCMLFGVVGSAIATLISMILVVFMQLITTSKFLKIPFKKIMPWKELGLISFINLLLGGVIYTIEFSYILKNSNNEYINIFIVCSIFFIIYFLIMKKNIMEKWYKLNNSQ